MITNVEASINALWQNLIALNASLLTENIENNQQLIQMKKKLQEVCAVDHIASVVTIELENLINRLQEAELTKKYQKELSKKNSQILRLNSKLQSTQKTVKKLTSDLSENIDENDNEEMSSSSTSAGEDTLATDFTTTLVDRQTIKEENLLTPLLSIINSNDNVAVLGSSLIHENTRATPLNLKTDSISDNQPALKTSVSFNVLENEKQENGRRSRRSSKHIYLNVYSTPQKRRNMKCDKFACDICGAEYTLKANMNRHKRTKH